MNIDERLDRLTERHEVLRQSVELLTHSQEKNETLMTQVIESVNSLARIAHAHERRVSDLEHGRT